MNYSVPATADLVRSFLSEAYVATPEQIDALMGTDAAQAILTDASRFGSYVYYAGSEIAKLADLAESPGMEEALSPDEDEDDDDY